MINLDPSSGKPLVEQIVSAVTQSILSRQWRPGSRVQSIREFARTHAVSTSTVVEGYDRLVALGLLTARPQQTIADVMTCKGPLWERLLQPFSPYGVSKVGVECLGFQYHANYGIAVYLPRLFIHVGTGHPPATAIQNFARQLALISKGKAEAVMTTGVLTTARDFIDVRDGVEGMMLLLEAGRPGQPVNICTGTAFKISEILEMLIDISGLKVSVETDPSLMRPSDEPLLLGDNSKLRALGWRQKYTMRQTLTAVYEDWLSRI